MTLYLKEKLSKQKNLGNLRQLTIRHKLIDFSSNDYLGLARSSDLAKSVSEEFERHVGLLHLNGLGSTGSRLLTGNSTYAQDLEDKIAHFHHYEAGTLFNCGYMANVGLLSTVASDEDTILFDVGVHASTHDGIHLSGAKAFAFKHNDLEHLEHRLRRSSLTKNCFICVESIYSTDGSRSPLKGVSQLAEKYSAHLIVDEAHAVGVCGSSGRGCVAELNLTSKIFAQINTFGKALGTHGAIVLGNHTLKQALVNFARPYIYTTALPFYSLAAIKCSYDLLPSFETKRENLQELIQLFRKVRDDEKTSESHIQSVKIAGNESVKISAEKLMQKGFDVRALTSPTVKRGREILRICLHAYNTKDELLALLKVIESINRS